MPKKELSPVAKSLLTLLNNVHDLIVISNRRSDARDVIFATKALAKEKNYEIPLEKIDNLIYNLMDSRTDTLSFLILDITQDIIKK
jgi:hypothetical protein